MRKRGMMQMSKIRNVVINIYDMLRQDEELLRLLHYPPHDGVNPSPLSNNYTDITSMDMDDYWQIVDNHILTTSKTDDLQSTPICRIYVYQGRNRRTYNKLAVRHEIVIDVFCHHDYVNADSRMQSIEERLQEILSNSRVGSGLGRIEYDDGYPFNAPLNYESFRHIFLIGGSR